MNNKKVNFTFRIPTDLKEKLVKQADKENRTLSNLIISILTESTNKIDDK